MNEKRKRRTTRREERPPIPLQQRELWDATDVGRMFGRGRSTIIEWNRDRLMPAPIYVHKSVLWRRRELIDWLNAGVPERSSWRWQPGRPARVAHYLAIIEKDLAELTAQRDRLRADLEAGRVFVNVETRR